MKNYLQLTRPFNCIFVASTVLFGAFFNQTFVFDFPVLFAVLSAVFIAAGGYVINDVYDYEIDCINRPDRVLPSKKVSLHHATVFGYFLFSAGMISSIFTNHLVLIGIAFLNAILLYMYAKKWKYEPIIGNLVVAYSAASTFLFGGIANHNIIETISIICIAFLLTLSRELIKDAEDIEGDKSLQAKTFAVLKGGKATVLFSFSTIFLAVIYSGIAYYFNTFSCSLFMSLFSLVYLPILVLHFFCFYKNSKKSYTLLSKLLKIEMIITLVIIVLLG